MVEFLIEEPLLLLFIVSGLGYLLGNIKVKGISLGVAAVLFVGLAFGALSPDMHLPPVIVDLGLIIFVYTIGLSSGPGFFASFRRKGLRDNSFVFLMLILAALLTAGFSFALNLKATVAAGMYAGSLTNTPALAGILETIARNAPVDQLETVAAEPVIGYSVAYPMGVIGLLLAVYTMQRVFKIDYKAEAKTLRQYNIVEQDLYTRTVLISNPSAIGVPVSELFRRHEWDVVLSRIRREGELALTTGDTIFNAGDEVTLIGTPEEVDRAVAGLGRPSGEQLELDRSEYDFRRIFVSNHDIAGRSLNELDLPRAYGAIVSRVRRGDIDLLARGDTVLELGDRARVVARRTDMPRITALFGDSYKALSEVNLLTLSFGLALGVLIGLIPIPLPGGVVITLGMAGGPLLVGLVLGAVRRTRGLVWTIPYSANLTLRQIGLSMLLAGIGIRSGYTFLTNFTASGGLQVFFAGALITLLIAFLTLIIGYKVLKVPFGMLTGMLAGLGTQPAALGFGLQQADNELPNLGYALVFPVATITKVIVAQLLLIILS
ncbi:MAG: transporter [Anaerolineae bacterium]|nr:MAG: transporter [Anaerolineae bacterium]